MTKYYYEEGYLPQWEIDGKLTIRYFTTGGSPIQVDVMKLVYDGVDYEKATPGQVRKLMRSIFTYPVVVIE